MDLVFVIILGALWGSFANVCIIRIPQGKGVVFGRSFCVKCKKKFNGSIIFQLFLSYYSNPNAETAKLKFHFNTF